MARDPLSIAVVQPKCASHAVAANAAAHAAAVLAADARVVVFPELSLTGYELDAEALTPDDARFEPIVDACRETGALALVGAPVQGRGGQLHIAFVAVDSGGAAVAYHKLWLGADETRRFSPGSEPVALEVDGWRLGLAICKDTGVARHAADTAALGIDVYVAGTVKHAEESAVQDERARRVAVEHRVWVAVASFAGPTGGGFVRTAGRSGIWAPGGALIAQAGPEVGAVVRATLG